MPVPRGQAVARCLAKPPYKVLEADASLSSIEVEGRCHPSSVVATTHNEVGDLGPGQDEDQEVAHSLVMTPHASMPPSERRFLQMRLSRGSHYQILPTRMPRCTRTWTSLQVCYLYWLSCLRTYRHKGLITLSCHLLSRVPMSGPPKLELGPWRYKHPSGSKSW